MAETSTNFEAKVLLMLLDQNQAAQQTDAVMFKKLDEAAGLAREAVTTAREAHAETMEIKAQIDDKFKVLNGTIAKSIDRLKKLEDKDGERDAEALQEALKSHAVKVATEGVWMMPKPSWRQLTVIGGAIAFMGADRIFSTIRWLCHLLGRI